MGNWDHDQCSGYGKYFYYNGDINDGQWTNHFRHGPGIHIYGDTGIKWQGSWHNGIRVMATPETQASMVRVVDALTAHIALHCFFNIIV
jgi:hypothetical protein